MSSYEEVMVALRRESEFFFNSVPNKKLCQNTDSENILASNRIYLHRYSATVPCTAPVWDEIRNELRSMFPETDSLYLTPRRKSHCIEMGIFQSIKEMGLWMKWSTGALRHLFGRQYDFESVRHCRIAGTISRTETEITSPGLLRGLSFSGSNIALGVVKHPLYNGSSSLPAIAMYSIASSRQRSCVPIHMRGRFFESRLSQQMMDKECYVAILVKKESLAVSESHKYQFRPTDNTVHVKWTRKEKQNGKLDTSVPCVVFRGTAHGTQ